MLEKGFSIQQVIYRALRIHGKKYIFRYCMWKDKEGYMMPFSIIQGISLPSFTIITNYYLLLSHEETEPGFKHSPKTSQVISGICPSPCNWSLRS